MIYILTALFCEAKPIIQMYHLEKKQSCTHFQLFCNNQIALIISGQGKLNAAIAITELFHRIPPKETDLLLNLGIAGSTDSTIPIGSGFFCNRLLDWDTLHTYYPDFLYAHHKKEAQLKTVSKPYMNVSANEHTLIDMEATGVYTAAMYFMKQHQVYFYKIVSDHCNGMSLQTEDITSLISPHISPIIDYFKEIENTLATNQRIALSSLEISLINELSDALHCSVTMAYQLRQLFLYEKLNQVDIIHLLHTNLEKLKISPCKTKREGKKYCEQLRNELI